MKIKETVEVKNKLYVRSLESPVSKNSKNIELKDMSDEQLIKPAVQVWKKFKNKYEGLDFYNRNGIRITIECKLNHECFIKRNGMTVPAEGGVWYLIDGGIEGLKLSDRYRMEAGTVSSLVEQFAENIYKYYELPGLNFNQIGHHSLLSLIQIGKTVWSEISMRKERKKVMKNLTDTKTIAYLLIRYWKILQKYKDKTVAEPETYVDGKGNEVQIEYSADPLADFNRALILIRCKEMTDDDGYIPHEDDFSLYFSDMDWQSFEDCIECILAGLLSETAKTRETGLYTYKGIWFHFEEDRNYYSFHPNK